MVPGQHPGKVLSGRWIDWHLSLCHADAIFLGAIRRGGFAVWSYLFEMGRFMVLASAPESEGTLYMGAREHPGGLCENAQIISQGAVPHILRIHLEFNRQDLFDVEVLPVRFIGQQDLLVTEMKRGWSGDTGPHMQHDAAQGRLEAIHESWDLGAWTDQTHVAANNVPQLRQLIELGAAQETACGGNAAVVRRSHGWAVPICARLHCPEFADVKEMPIASNALLPVEQGPTRSKEHQDSSEQQGWTEQY